MKIGWHNRNSRPNVRRWTSWLRAFTGVGLFAVLAGGCPPTENVLTNDANGSSIRLSEIDAITTDENLTDEQKRESLRNLGITDATLIEQLVQWRGE